MSRKPLTPADRARGRRLAARITTARTTGNREQADLARESGVAVDTIRALEGGRISTPSFVIVARLARALGLELEELADEALGLRHDQ